MENLDQYLQKGTTPKYVTVNKIKCLTPSDIKKLPIYEGKYPIYGDPRIKAVIFDDEVLKNLEKKRQFLVVLKIPKSRGGMYAFIVNLNYMLKQRKFRLSNLINIQKVNEAEKKEVPSAAEFIRSMIEIKEGATEEEIFDEFQTSMDENLICMDIKRIIQLYYQEENDNRTKN